MNENDKRALNRITKQAAKVTQSELSSIIVTLLQIFWLVDAHILYIYDRKHHMLQHKFVVVINERE